MTTQELDFFNTLFEENRKLLLREATRELQSFALAEEIVEETFLTLLSRISEVMTHECPVGWLHKTLKYHLANEKRRASNRREQAIDALDNKNEPMEETEQMNRLEYCLPKGLSEEERQLLVWHFEQDRSYEDIAQKLGISVLGCRTKLFRAKKRCGVLLDKEKHQEN